MVVPGVTPEPAMTWPTARVPVGVPVTVRLVEPIVALKRMVPVPAGQ